MIGWSILTPLIGAMTCILLPSRYQRFVSLLVALVHGQLSLFILNRIPEDKVLVHFMGGWPAPFGITLTVDGFSALMLMVTSIIYVSSLLYSYRESFEAGAKKFFYPLVHFLLFGVSGAFVTGDYFNMYVWYEVMILSSFGLLLMTRKIEQIDGILKYAVLNFLASSFFLMGLGLLYGQLGTLNIADITEKARSITNIKPLLGPVLLVSLGFLMKAGAFPLYSWLPSSYHLPSFSASALFAGLLTKVGLYSAMRFLIMSFPMVLREYQPIFVGLAAFTMFFGVQGAVASFDVRKILSFHIISQIGYMLTALVGGTPAVVAAAIFYVVHHILVKSNLFLVAGELRALFGSEQLQRMGAALKHKPWLAGVFIISGFSLGGIPPLSGFWAKWSLLRALFAQGEWLLITVALWVSLWTLFSMVKIWSEAFQKPLAGPKGEKWESQLRLYDESGETSLEAMEEGPTGMESILLARIAMFLLAFGTLLISFFPDFLFERAHQAAQNLVEPKDYIERVLRPQDTQTISYRMLPFLNPAQAAREQ